MSKNGYRTRELETANFTHRGMSCIRYGEGGKGMADGGCSVSSIEGVHDSYIVVISGRWIMYDTGDWDFKLDSDRMGKAVYAKLITSVEALKRAIIESYGLVGMSVAVEMSYWLREHGSCVVGEREAPVQISNDKACSLRHSKEVASSNQMQVGSTSADVHTRNEVNDVDGTTCEVQNKVDTTKDAALGEGEDDDDEDYDYNLWHDFVGRNCEWDDDKDDDGGVGGGCRTNVTYGGVRGEVVTKTRSGRTNPSSNKGSGPSTNKQRTTNPPSTFEDYVDECRDYIGSSRISMENIEEASNNLGVKSSDQVADTENHSDPNQEEDPSLDNNSQMLVLQTPPKPFNMHTQEVDDSDDFVGQVPQCVSSRPTHDTSDGVYEDDDFVEPVPMCVSGGQTHETPDGEDEDDDFVEPVPQCVSGGQTHETLVGEDEDDDFIEPVPQSRSREEDARRRREKDKADDESLMKSVRAVELYGFEDVESSSNNEAVNDYTVDDIDFTLADADMYTGKLFSSKQEFKITIASLRNQRTMVGMTPATQKTYPPQPEVEFGFPQTCYCGGRPKLATSRTVNDPGRRYYTCENVNDGDCHVHKWWDDAVDYLTFLNDYDPQLNKLKELQNETEQKLVRLEKVVSELAENRTSGCGWAWMDGSGNAQLMGTRNFPRRESALHSEVEALTPNNLSSQHPTISLHHTHQYHKMTDPYYKEMKHHKREYDWVSNCVYANYKIPTKCICGGAITVEADDRGINYYVCKDFKNDGLHIRHDCLTALEEELDCLRSQYAEEVSLRRELQFEVAQMRKMTVAKYKRFFYSLPIVDERTEPAVDRVGQGRIEGRDPRGSLETDEFATLEALFEEAEEVEEGLKETPPSTPRKRRRRSPNPRSSKRARKAEEKGDPEDDRYGYDGEGASGFKDDEEGEYWDWMQMETDVDDDASDRTDDTLENT
ncbi:hypothetical protein IGI04_035831 [Brassica rapa subsp. trilocularis]|uniref:GRF-type domain-containing protein n=1 Tax=Brassica rapa subsp. trilocularis TaxID=1813537 RepID=A0ABQ7LCR7_BRACM|nr:hypothetical protein IGI04_035831 [Brassica rapa subsp. trilocularis]